MGAEWNWPSDKHWCSAVHDFWWVEYFNVRLGASH